MGFIYDVQYEYSRTCGGNTFPSLLGLATCMHLIDSMLHSRSRRVQCENQSLLGQRLAEPIARFDVPCDHHLQKASMGMLDVLYIP